MKSSLTFWTKDLVNKCIKNDFENDSCFRKDYLEAAHAISEIILKERKKYA